MMNRSRRGENPRSLGWCDRPGPGTLPAMTTITGSETITVRGTTIVVRTATPRVTVTDHTIPAGFPGPPLHVHPGFDEVFIVLEGTVTLRAGDDVQEAGPGGTLHVAGETPHTFANQSAAPARFLVAITPGGFEEYFRAMAAGDDARVAAVSERFGYAPVPSD
jgi:quercetin dioxygenase-like cupin family protein